MRVPPAHPQNTGDNPLSIPSGISVSNAPTNPKIIIEISTNPIISSNFAIFFLLYSLESKRYMVL